MARGTDRDWELYGATDPYYGVLTDERYRRDRLDDGAKAHFFATGEDHVARVLATVSARLDPGFAPGRALDFGCGVGRVLLPLARRTREAVGVDVSPSMLDEARANAREQGVENVAFVLSDDTLSRVAGTFDFVHSYIVLQHVPKERGMRLFARLVELVAPGGAGVIQTVYKAASGRTLRQRLGRFYLYRLAGNLLRGRLPGPRMEMNAYELGALFDVLHEHGVRHAFVEQTDHGGHRGVTLYFQRERQRSRPTG